MPSDFYGAKGAIGGIFKGTGVTLSVNESGGTGGGGQKGALVQSVNLSYTRNITRVWELGSDDSYYIIGHTEGQAGMQRIVAKADEDILDKLSDACKAKTQTLTLASNPKNDSDSCDATAMISLIMAGPVLTNRSFSVDAGQFIVNSQATIMFASLKKGAA